MTVAAAASETPEVVKVELLLGRVTDAANAIAVHVALPAMMAA